MRTVGPWIIFSLLVLAIEGFRPAAARAATGDAVVSGEVLIVPGDDEMFTSDNGKYTLKSLPAVTRKAITAAGDTFHAITIWMTFDDRSNNALAYETAIKNDVTGLGLPLVNMAREFGSPSGTLRSLLNMKAVGLRAGDTRATWEDEIATWGQESSHRWMMFMKVRDPRNGATSDVLLGRDCAHYSRFTDTQASIHDGFAWSDNGDGTFTTTGTNLRYGNLDLYGMGLLAADELSPFFFIDKIPGYTAPPCTMYNATAKPTAKTVSGQRVDITVDDIVAANGRRLPEPYDVQSPQDYWRELQVILTRPDETAESPNPRALAARINKARLWWEDWNRSASSKRLVMCTRLSADCGDPRSDVVALAFNPAAKAPAQGPLALEVNIKNSGGAEATGIETAIEISASAKMIRDSQKLGTLPPGTMRTQTFKLDLVAVSCGAAITAKVSTQSDFHHHRKIETFLVGVETKFRDDFEIDNHWTANPDGDDTSMGARWERGAPETTEVLGTVIQPAQAHGGASAWATGLAAKGTQSTFVKEGKTTLQSPPISATGLRAPQLRYWLSFAGVRANADGTAVEPSPDSRFIVLGHAVPESADSGATTQGWVEIERIAGGITSGWVQRTAALPAPLANATRLQFRFIAEDANPQRGGAEAAIDDLEIVSNLPACAATTDGGTSANGEAGDGCACHMAGHTRTAPMQPGMALWLAFAAIHLSRWRVKKAK